MALLIAGDLILEFKRRTDIIESVQPSAAAKLVYLTTHNRTVLIAHLSSMEPNIRESKQNTLIKSVLYSQ